MMKTCTKCRQPKDASCFTKRAAAKDGLFTWCKECNRAWRKENIKQRMDYQREYQAKNREYVAALNAAWMRRNAEHQTEMKRKYRKENPHIKAAIHARYTAQKKRSTPIWADQKKIGLIYEEAARLTKATGILHHVDHIYPLQSNWCCGLHVEGNLQVLPAKVNQSKSNRPSKRYHLESASVALQ